MVFYEYSISGGEISNYEFTTIASAVIGATLRFMDMVEDWNPRPGELFSESVEVWSVDEDAVVTHVHSEPIEYEFYHGDYTEHALTNGDVL